MTRGDEVTVPGTGAGQELASQRWRIAAGTALSQPSGCPPSEATRHSFAGVRVSNAMPLPSWNCTRTVSGAF